MDFNRIVMAVTTMSIVLYVVVTYGKLFVSLFKKKGKERIDTASETEVLLNETVLRIGFFREPNDEVPFDESEYMDRAKEIADILTPKINSVVSESFKCN